MHVAYMDVSSNSKSSERRGQVCLIQHSSRVFIYSAICTFCCSILSGPITCRNRQAQWSEVNSEKLYCRTVQTEETTCLRSTVRNWGPQVHAIYLYTAYGARTKDQSHDK